MKSMKNIFLTSFLLFGLTGCLMTRAQLGDSRSKQEVQSQQIAAQKEMQKMESAEEMRQLNGRIEALENQLAQAQQVLQSQKVSEAGVNAAKADRLKLLEQALEKLDLKMMALSNEFRVYVKSSVSKKAKKTSAKKGSFTNAESLFKKKEWKKAIVSYEDYREKNPKGRSYSVATYKIGVCFQELKMGDAAKSFYQEVLDKFPKSSVAKKAKYRLSKLR